MFRLLSKVLEREPQSPHKLQPQVPQELAQVVLRCLEKQPEARFADYGELCDALRPFSSTTATPAALSLRFLAWAIVPPDFYGLVPPPRSVVKEQAVNNVYSR